MHESSPVEGYQRKAPVTPASGTEYDAYAPARIARFLSRPHVRHTAVTLVIPDRTAPVVT